MKLVVLKFGGTSVADVPQIKKIALKVKEEVNKGNKVIVVVSAMSGVTNDLIEEIKTDNIIEFLKKNQVAVISGFQCISN